MRSLLTCVPVLSLTALSLCLLAPCGETQAQQAKYETGPDGTTYLVTQRSIPKTVVTTRMQTREETVYQPQQTTTYHTYQNRALAPVTEYRWVSRQKGFWNPFQAPYWAHAVEPVTSWKNVATTTQVPVTSTSWVPAKRTVQTPVTSYETVTDTVVVRTPVASPTRQVAASTGQGGTVQVASRAMPGQVGGQRLDQPVRWGAGRTYRR